MCINPWYKLDSKSHICVTETTLVRKVSVSILPAYTSFYILDISVDIVYFLNLVSWKYYSIILLTLSYQY